MSALCLADLLEFASAWTDACVRDVLIALTAGCGAGLPFPPAHEVPSVNVRHLLCLSLAMLCASAAGSTAQGDFADPAWQYTTKAPADGWEKPGFDDSGWKTGFGGFGDPSTPGTRISTTWYTPEIWLRRTVELDSVPAEPALLIHHDEDADVFINGTKAASFTGFITEYRVHRLDAGAAKLLTAGSNLIAVHCTQTGGGQSIDVHLVDAAAVPSLPAPKRPEQPFVSELITAWGGEVTPENAWREYPRPQLVRDSWTNLNGSWNYAITPMLSSAAPSTWDGEILVPFAVEAKLSGVQRLLHDDQALWYSREIQATATAGRRTLLHFEACDYRMTAWLNGIEVGQHTGGNLPFSFDITEALGQGDGTSTLVVRVEDATGDYQLRGKQNVQPHGIFYTQVSGIYGTVWLEEVPETYLRDIFVETRCDGTVTFRLDVVGPQQESELIASLGGKRVASAKVATASDPITLSIADPQLWSPDSPTLYDLELRIGSDRVTSYFGIREVGRVKDADGHWRFTLNGEPIFHFGPLDQGWWPDGLLTPPSDEAMRWDVDYLKAAGFNMIRKHIKVEPRRFYTYCDQVGMLLWQDHVAGFPNPPWTRLDPNPTDIEWPVAAREQFMDELDTMITQLDTHPSIVVWVPFNEAWGQHRTVEMGEWTVARDPSRLVNIASGGNFWPAGHIVDEHRYPHPGFPFELDTNGRFDDFIKVVGEFGGHGLPVQGHLWDTSTRNWGYGSLPKNKAEYLERYQESIRRLVELKGKGIAAGVYTQTTDVEGEINGLITYDRAEIKIPAEQLKAMHEPLYAE